MISVLKDYYHLTCRLTRIFNQIWKEHGRCWSWDVKEGNPACRGEFPSVVLSLQWFSSFFFEIFTRVCQGYIHLSLSSTGSKIGSPVANPSLGTQRSPPPLGEFRNHPNLDLCIADSFCYFSSRAPILRNLSGPCRERTRNYWLSFYHTGKYFPIDPVDCLVRVC